MKILIVYYSGTGHTEAMARAIAAGARERRGIEVVVKKAEDATNKDLLDADGIVIGSPTYFRLPAWPVKKFIDESIDVYHKLSGKIGGVFTSTGSFYDGVTCLQALRAVMEEHGIRVVEKGALAIEEPDAEELEACRRYGFRIASCTLGELKPYETWHEGR